MHGFAACRAWPATSPARAPRRPAPHRSTASAPGRRRAPSSRARWLRRSGCRARSSARRPAPRASRRAANRHAPSRTGSRPRLLRRRRAVPRSRTACLRAGRSGWTTPPPAMILIWLAPLRTCSRTARRTSPTPSAIAPIRPSPAQLQNISRSRAPCGRMSAWPPVCEIGKTGDEQPRPFEQPAATASRSPKSAPAASRTLVKPRCSMSRMICALCAHSSDGGCSARRDQVVRRGDDVHMRIDQARAARRGPRRRCRAPSRPRSVRRRPRQTARRRSGCGCSAAARPSRCRTAWRCGSACAAPSPG